MAAADNADGSQIPSEHVPKEDVNGSETHEEVEKDEAKAKEFKEKGNLLFQKEQYEEAIECYTKALEHAPDNYADRAIFYANRAACYLHLKNYDAVIKDCTSALGINANYEKALLRRAQAYEQTKKYIQALEDYKKVATNNPANKQVAESIRRLTPLAAEQQEKEKEEMIATLKKLGDTILRPFGLSTSNFKLEKDPKSGGYSISMQK